MFKVVPQQQEIFSLYCFPLLYSPLRFASSEFVYLSNHLTTLNTEPLNIDIHRNYEVMKYEMKIG